MFVMPIWVKLDTTGEFIRSGKYFCLINIQVTIGKSVPTITVGSSCPLASFGAGRTGRVGLVPVGVISSSSSTPVVLAAPTSSLVVVGVAPTKKVTAPALQGGPGRGSLVQAPQLLISFFGFFQIELGLLHNPVSHLLPCLLFGGSCSG